MDGEPEPAPAPEPAAGPQAKAWESPQGEDRGEQVEGAKAQREEEVATEPEVNPFLEQAVYP